MNKTLTLATAFLFSISLFSQNEWAPVGATWHYECWSVFTPPHLESAIVTGDTVIQGINCRIIERYSESYTYEENGKVHIFNPADTTFGLLYNFNTQPGDHWKIKLNEFLLWPFDSLTIEVDSIMDRQVSGQSIRTQLVSFYSDQGELLGTDSIFENIGSAHQLLGLFTSYNPDSIVDEGGPCNLHCFEIPNFDALHFYGHECIISNNKEQLNNDPFFSISPNPATDYLHISFNKYQPHNNGSFHIFDINGRLVKNVVIEQAAEMDISLHGIPAGFYFLKYLENGLVVSVERFVVSK